MGIASEMRSRRHGDGGDDGLDGGGVDGWDGGGCDGGYGGGGDGGLLGLIFSHFYSAN